MDEQTCVCGCWLIEKYGWKLCPACGGAITNSGKYLPPDSGWTFPKLTDQDKAKAWGERQQEEDVANFWRVAF